MAGGIWIEQNKVRAGAYINVQTNGLVKEGVSNVGVIALPMQLGFAPENEVIAIEKSDNIREKLGYELTAPELKLLREAFKRVNKVLVYRINLGGEKATAEICEGVTATARYTGTLGNTIIISIKANLKDIEKFDVVTYLNSALVDKQTVATTEELQDNAYVQFTGEGVLATNAGATLQNGTDGTVEVRNYTEMLDALSVQDFNALAVPTKDETVKEACVGWARRMRDTEGKYIQVVVSELTADDEAVIDVLNGVILKDGTTIEPHEATVWVAAASAGAGVKSSNTYTTYEGAVDVTTRYTNSKIIEALQAGQYLFTPIRGRVVVEQDINSLTTFTDAKNQWFAKNRVLRTLDDIANNTKREFEDNFIGKVQNNQDGRELFKINRINYFNNLQALGAIEEFQAEDIEVLAGKMKDSIVVNVAVKPVDAMEKLYMTVEVQ